MIKSSSHIPVIETLLTFVDLPMAVFSRERSLQNISPSAIEVLGTVPRDLDEMLELAVSDANDRKELISRLNRLWEDNQPIEMAITRRSESNVSEVKVFTAVNDGGDTALVVHLRTAERSPISQERMEHLQRQATIGQVAAGVAHEFNNILTALLGWTQLAQRSAGESPQASSALSTIEANTKRARQIAAELLSIARPERTDETTFSPDKVIEDTLQLLSWDLNAAHIKVEKSLESGLTCTGNPTKLLQVFVNLLRNAIDATPSGGTIQVRSGATTTGLAIEISDTGNGICEEDLPHIFEPFYSTKRGTGTHGGTGLGLPISKRIVEEYGGTMSVTSRRPGGTRFNIDIPCRQPEITTIVEGDSPRSSFPPGIAVLVVDDEPDICEMVRTVLSLRGAHVVSAMDGEEALARCREERFDVAFVDFSMAGLSGHDLSRAIVELQPSLPVVFMSGVEIPPDKNPSFVDFLKKPFDLHEIQQKLREIIDEN